MRGPMSDDQTSKRPTKKTEQDKVLRSKPNTCMERIVVSDNITFAQKETFETAVLHYADEDAVRSTTIANAKNDKQNWDDEQSDNAHHRLEAAGPVHRDSERRPHQCFGPS